MKDEQPQINMSSIQVAGVGGLGMVAVAAVMAYVLPELRLFVFAALGGGVIAAVALIASRRWNKSQPTSHPTLMVGGDAPKEEQTDRLRRNSHLKFSTVRAHD
jgi:hypothetical protein